MQRYLTLRRVRYRTDLVQVLGEGGADAAVSINRPTGKQFRDKVRSKTAIQPSEGTGSSKRMADIADRSKLRHALESPVVQVAGEVVEHVSVPM